MTDFESNLDTSRYASLQDVESAAAAGGTQIVDARSHEQFTGAVRRARHGGHVPGAVNVPHSSVVDSQTGELLDESHLESVFEAAGVELNRPGILYCNGGVSACVVEAALTVLGSENWRVYDGSWNEYGNLDAPALEGSEAVTAR